MPEELSRDTQFALDLPACNPNKNLLTSPVNQNSLPRRLMEEQLRHQSLSPKCMRLSEIFGCMGSFAGTCQKISVGRVILLATKLLQTQEGKKKKKNISKEVLEDFFTH